MNDDEIDDYEEMMSEVHLPWYVVVWRAFVEFWKDMEGEDQ